MSPTHLDVLILGFDFCFAYMFKKSKRDISKFNLILCQTTTYWPTHINSKGLLTQLFQITHSKNFIPLQIAGHLANAQKFTRAIIGA